MAGGQKMVRPMSATLHLFPLDKRIGKIRSTAAKMLAKTTDRHAEFYREQVTEALRAHLKKIGADEIECSMQLSAFWLVRAAPKSWPALTTAISQAVPHEGGRQMCSPSSRDHHHRP